MRSHMNRLGTIAAVALVLLGASIAVSTDADARHWRGGGWIGPAIIGGLALGAFAASRPYYGYPPYGYDVGPCVLERRIVGYTAWGRPIVRRVRVCY